jgi:monothiol glutaredoxin
MSTEIENKIKKFINSKHVAIFMKGSPDHPQCGFSGQVVKALRFVGVPDDELAHFDVLSDESIRQGIKEFSNWPTIPQVFVGGEFLGGSDIVVAMAQNGELKEKIKE